VVRTERGSRLSRGEISGGEAPRTLFGTKFVVASSSVIITDFAITVLQSSDYTGPINSTQPMHLDFNFRCIHLNKIFQYSYH